MTKAKIKEITKSIYDSLLKEKTIKMNLCENDNFFNLIDDEKYDEYTSIITEIKGNLLKMKNVSKVNLEWGKRNWSMKYNIPLYLTAYLKPCKEFGQLNNWLEKYASRPLAEDEVKTDRVFGKRSWYEPEYSNYLIHEPNRCKEILSKLREKRSTKDSLILSKKHYLDDGNRYNGYGEDMECEWNGSEVFFTEVKIKTPTGREKAVIDICA